MANCHNCERLVICHRASPEEIICSLFKAKPITNADRIRVMTDEELAQRLYLSTCVHIFDNKVECKDNGCKKCWLDWLKQEDKK